MEPAHSELGVTIYHGDSLAVLPELAENSVDACVCDPPYGLEFMGKDWDRLGAPAYRREQRADEMGDPVKAKYLRHSVEYVGGSEAQAWHEQWARAVFRVLKPGAHLLAFGGTRTHHRLMCALEDAGFEIRDTLCWLYGQGFPKSLNVSKELRDAVCRCCADHAAVLSMHAAHASILVSDQEMEVADLFPAMQRDAARGRVGEARLEGATCEGLSAAGNEGRSESGLEGRGDAEETEGQLPRGDTRSSTDVGIADGTQGRLHTGAPSRDGDVVRSPADQSGDGQPHRPQSVAQLPSESGIVADEPRSQTWGSWSLCSGCGKPLVPDGLGTALKPSYEPIILARKPLSEPNVAANVLRLGTGALNIDQCRVGTSGGTASVGEPNLKNRVYGHAMGGLPSISLNSGRWPSNLLLDEQSAEMLDARSGESQSPSSRPRSPDGPAKATWALGRQGGVQVGHGDSGGASRFFFTAKADRADRDGSKHPTVKPTDLMGYLVRLVTPPGGVVLDPFMGSGSTIWAAREYGFRAIGIDREREYVDDAVRRLRQGLLL